MENTRPSFLEYMPVEIQMKILLCIPLKELVCGIGATNRYFHTLVGQTWNFWRIFQIATDSPITETSLVAIIRLRKTLIKELLMPFPQIDFEMPRSQELLMCPTSRMDRLLMMLSLQNLLKNISTLDLTGWKVSTLAFLENDSAPCLKKLSLQYCCLLQNHDLPPLVNTAIEDLVMCNVAWVTSHGLAKCLPPTLRTIDARTIVFEPEDITRLMQQCPLLDNVKLSVWESDVSDYSRKYPKVQFTAYSPWY